MAAHLQEALLSRGDTIHAYSLSPLYLFIFLKMLASVMAVWPLGALKVFFCALTAGSDEATASVVLGIMIALRYLTEFVGAEVLVSLSGVFGCRSILVASSAALAVECGLMAISSTPTTLGVVHVAFGLAFSAGSFESHCIVRSLKSRKKQMAAHEHLLDLLGVVLIVGPVLAGRLATKYSYTGPFVCGYVLSIAATYAILFWVPQSYAAKLSPQRKDGPPVGMPLVQPGPSESEAASCERPSPKYAWFCCAMALSGMGMAAFGATFMLWMQVCLRRETETIFNFIAFGNFLQVLSRVVPLPHFAKGPVAVQLGLGITALRFVVLAGGPSEVWTLAALAATWPGFCTTPLLSELCASQAPGGRLELWSRRLAGLNSAASALGALAGSRLLASSIRGEVSSGSPLLFVAACHFLAGACVSQGLKAQSRSSTFGESAASLEVVV